MNEESCCIWKEEKGLDTDGIYKTDCDNMFTIMEGNPEDNGFKYCPYCSKAIVEDISPDKVDGK